MEIEKINYLRKRIISTISECEDALNKADGELEKALELIKSRKTELIVKETGVSVNVAVDMYQSCSGDVNGAINKLLYQKNSKEWEEKNIHKVEEYINRINSVRCAYELFELCPMGTGQKYGGLFEILYDFYSSFAPCELDNIALTADEKYFDEIRNSLREIKYLEMVQLFDCS